MKDKNATVALVTELESELAEVRKRAWEDGVSCDTAEHMSRDNLRALCSEKIHHSLVLREQELHGELGPALEYLQSQIEERSRRLLELNAESQDAANATPSADQRSWTFQRRRAAACECFAGLAAAVCFS